MHITLKLVVKLSSSLKSILRYDITLPNVSRILKIFVYNLMEISLKNQIRMIFACCFCDLSICCWYEQSPTKAALLLVSCVDGCYLSEDSSPDIISEALGIKSKKKSFKTLHAMCQRGACALKICQFKKPPASNDVIIQSIKKHG